MTDNSKFDRLLDKALSEYGNVSPREGFEHRILATLASPKPDRSWSRGWWWLAVPSMAAVLVVMAFFMRATRNPGATQVASITPTARVTTTQATPAPKLTDKPTVALKKTQRRNPSVGKRSRQEAPRLATFPSGYEAEQQARLLLLFVTRHPDQAQQIVREEQQFQELAELSMNRDAENKSERER